MISRLPFRLTLGFWFVVFCLFVFHSLLLCRLGKTQEKEGGIREERNEREGEEPTASCFERSSSWPTTRVSDGEREMEGGVDDNSEWEEVHQLAL